MARIRSDKPESYQSETLAEISLAAERTFRGMATIADDRGRLPDKPAQINGELWAMRSERQPHSREDLEAELAEMIRVNLVCRYTGCDGKSYLHMVSWDRHQKIDHASKSRLPRCPAHQPEPDECGLHKGACPRESSRGFSEGSRPGGTGHPAAAAAGGLPAEALPAEAVDNHQPVTCGNQADLREHNSSRESREGSRLDRGSRIVDLGSWISDARAREVTDLADRFGRVTDDDKALHIVIDKIHERTGTVIDASTARLIVDDIRRSAKRQVGNLRGYVAEAIRREKDPAGRWLTSRPPAGRQPPLMFAVTGGRCSVPDTPARPPSAPGDAKRGAALARELMAANALRRQAASATPPPGNPPDTSRRHQEAS